MLRLLLLGRRRRIAHLLKPVILPLIAVSSCALAHGVGPWGVQTLEWKNDQISQVIVFDSTGRRVGSAGKDCIAGGQLSFNVRDEYAFDIDETVWLDVEFGAMASDRVSVSYDGNNSAPGMGAAGTPDQFEVREGEDGRWRKQSITLNRARFANLGFGGSDFTIRASGSPPDEVVICQLALRRSFATRIPTAVGWVSIDVTDENGEQTPARMGIYDASGRLSLPSDEAVSLRYFNGLTRIVPIGPGASPWPVNNRSAFYTDGRYRARLPYGHYELVVAKGPEYRVSRQSITIEPNETKAIKVKLRRWRDMAKRGWYSGEDHIHYARESAYDDRNLQILTQAEDLKIANILQMGNNANTYYNQHDWRPLRVHGDSPFTLVPGQEDPRTTHLGHTISLNIRRPLRNPERYLVYHEILEATRADGGLAGYSHVLGDPEWLGSEVVRRGMAIDVPFGIVDFAEIMSMNFAGSSIWFDFLNLGYKLSPSAGTDYPWGDVPGTVRNYVKIDKLFDLQAWFQGLKEGRTFVTSGPMLEMTANGKGVGTEIHLTRGEPLLIAAKASINPDVDVLSELELIEQGQPVKTISSRGEAWEMELSHAASAKNGTWFVLRARGRSDNVVALSAPIYVIVDGEGFWKPTEVPSIVAKMKLAMQQVLEPVQVDSTEQWDTREFIEKYWNAQHGLLKQRIDHANAMYDDLLRRAAERQSNINYDAQN